MNLALGQRELCPMFVQAGAGRHTLETTRRGVFAIGDVRAKSVKRVAAAVAEGAQVVVALLTYLAGDNPNLEPVLQSRLKAVRIKAIE